MTIDEVTTLMRWNVAMYSNSAKPLTDENAATQIAIWSAELADVPAYAGAGSYAESVHCLPFSGHAGRLVRPTASYPNTV